MSSRSKVDDGFILIAVLWMLAALATLASLYSVYALETAAASRVPDDRLQFEASAHAGVELAAFRLLAFPEPTRPSQGAFEARVGRTKVTVRFRPELAFIDLNGAPKPLLAGLFTAIGVPDAVAADYAAHIVAWRTKADPNKPDDTEAAAYKTAGLAYAPRQGPFNDTLELALVRGLPQSVAARVERDVTVFTGQALIDVLTADPEVLSAMPGVTPAIVKKVLAARGDGSARRQDIIDLLGTAGINASPEAGKAYRAIVDVDLARGRRIEAVVAFKLGEAGDEQPFQIVYWRDDFDGPSPGA